MGTTDSRGADAPIGIFDSPGTQVLHNTVLIAGTYQSAIEYRFAGSSNLIIKRNLVDAAISARDGASATVSGNVTNATAAMFVDAASGDLHLKATATTAIDRIAASNLIEVVLTDSVPLPERKRLAKITTLSVAPLIGEAIRRIHRGESVGALFSSEVSLTQEMVLWEGGDEGTIDTRGGEPGDDAVDGETDDGSEIDAFAASAQARDR
jgi:hypothetical protein